MLKKTLLTTLSLIVAVLTAAQISPVIPSAITIANTSVAVSDQWSAFHNVSALAHIENMEFSAQYENKFMLSELGTQSVQAGFNAKYVNIGVAFSYHGFSLYNEMLGGISIARNFGDKFSMGIQFDYYTAYFSTQEESQYRGALLGQFGVSSHILPKLTIGFHTFNPFQTNIKTEYSEKRLPSIYSIGTNYEFNPQLRWLTQIDKEASSNFRFATGFEYTMVEQLTIKLGASGSDYLVPALGFGLHLGAFHFHLNGELHPILGLNTMANLKYKL